MVRNKLHDIPPYGIIACDTESLDKVLNKGSGESLAGSQRLAAYGGIGAQ